MSQDSKQRPYKQVARAEAREQTRDALLDAASEEFFEGQWLKTSLESLSAKAGVTKQTLLRHFGSKDGLLIQAMMRTGGQARDQRWSAPAGDIPGVVDNLLDHYEDWGTRSMRIGAWQDGPTILAMISHAARQFHYNWVDYAFAPQLEDLNGVARIQCRAALIAICDVQTWWIFSHDLKLSRSEVRTTLINMITRMIADEQ